MALVPKYSLRRMIERGVQNIVTLDVRDNTVTSVSDANQQTATVGTYTLYDGSTLLVDAASVTSLGPPASHTIAASTLPTTLSLGDDLQERWALTIGGKVETFVRPASLVRFIPRMVIDDDDVVKTHTQLRRLRDDDETTFFKAIDEAWTWIQNQLLNAGNRPELVLDSSQLREAHIFRTRFELFRDYASSTTTDAKYQKLADDYEARAQTAIDTVPLTYDSDEDGIDDEASKRTNVPTLSFNRPPCWG